MSLQRFFVGTPDNIVTHTSRGLRNVHGSGRKACDAWLAGSLCGSPIQVGPDRFHVYGNWKRDWSMVAVEFGTDHIGVIKSHRSPAPPGGVPG